MMGRARTGTVLGSLGLATALGALFSAVALTGSPDRAPAQIAPPAGPALRLAARVGLVTVGVAARASGLELRLITPQGLSVGRDGVEVSVLGSDGTGPPIQTASCGPGCRVAPVTLRRGRNRFTIRVVPNGAEPAEAGITIPWPLSGERRTLLRQAVRRTGRLSSVTVDERVSSDLRRGFVPTKAVTLTGPELLAIETYALRGAVDVRALPRRRGFRRIVYAVPTARIWYELDIGRDGLIHRERITGPNHLILRRLRGHQPAG